MSQMRKSIKIGSREIGPGHPVYIVFEAGPTHDGLETAKRLVDIAAGAGADAVKFQLLNAEAMVSSREVMFSYTRLVDRDTGQTEDVTEPLLDILRRRELPREQWSELIHYCREQGLEFFSTATDRDELEFLHANGVQTVKVCSGDVNYHHFLRMAAQYPWSIQLDTGSSSLGEVEQAVDVLEEAGALDIIINHCPSGYPARLESINLRIIQTIQNMFPYPVAFSDHTPGWEMDVAAVAMGADMIEKTITLDRTTRSPEHIMSLEPDEASRFIQTIRDVETALGNPRRILAPEERNKRLVARRSVFAACAIKCGDVLSQDMLAYSRPGDGIPADLDFILLGRRLKRDISTGEKLRLEDFE
jgi:N,N'-diacetyllegionaminate synthase